MISILTNQDLTKPTLASILTLLQFLYLTLNLNPMSIQALTRNVMKKMNFLDFAIFKVYLISIWILLSIFFPQILQADILFYAIPAILMAIVLIPKTFKKNKKADNFLDQVERNTHQRNTGDISLFKILMILIGLMAAKLFPELLQIDQLIYRWIAVFWASWFISLINHNK